MKRPVVTFLTDFGLADTYIGQMKGVVLSHRPDATLVDLTHQVPPQSVVAGAFHLSASWHWFPAGTVHIAVVDPGVGTSRRAIGMSFRDHVFLFPDNGLLSIVLDEAIPDLVVALENARVSGSSVSSTFHGRDVFASAAGKIVSGTPLETLGKSIDPSGLYELDLPRPVIDSTTITGRIMLIDHFGNAITNIFRDLLGSDAEAWAIECGTFSVGQLSHTYADVGSGDPLGLVSSMGTVELAVRDGSAAKRYDLVCGMHVTLRRNARS